MEGSARGHRMLLIAGTLALGFFLVSYFATDIAPTALAKAKVEVIRDILSGISASFMFLLVLNAAQLFQDTREKRVFRAFFGDLAESSQAVFVYPDFELAAPAAEALINLTVPEIYRKRSTHYPGSRFIDVPQIVASNDLLAIVIMATRLGRLLEDSPRILTDGQACVDPTKSLMSFGLTSNAITDLYLRTDLEPLFHIEDNAVDPKIILACNGEEMKYSRNEDEEYGIILRYRPDPINYPMTYWFICGGLAAAGTPAAAWNLSHNWRQYYERFSDEDFAVILKTSSDVLSYVNSREVNAVRRPARSAMTLATRRREKDRAAAASSPSPRKAG
jgi:hypothetical protein